MVRIQPLLDNRKNIFTGDGAKLITESDRYVLSNDGAFAFTYCREDAYVTCWNVASLESCRVEMDEQMRTQLFETAGAVLQMSFNAQENTLLLSFYIEENTPAPETATVLPAMSWKLLLSISWVRYSSPYPVASVLAKDPP